MIARLLGGLGHFGVPRALVMPDATGISALLLRAGAARTAASPPWPQVAFLEMPVTETADDTRRAVGLMRDAGVALIAVLGGDGTHRIVADACGDVPLLTLSTGTNNAFPEMREATVAGLAGGLVASGAVPRAVALRRNKVLRVRALHAQDRRAELALVDVCVARTPYVGSRALWDAGELTELFVAFAEEDAIGLSSIASRLSPVTRDEPHGLHVRFGDARAATAAPQALLHAPLAPGVVGAVVVESAERLRAGAPVTIAATRGTIALDGEREIEIGSRDAFAVELDLAGPFTVDVRRTLRYAAGERIFTSTDIWGLPQSRIMTTSLRAREST